MDSRDAICLEAGARHDAALGVLCGEIELAEDGLKQAKEEGRGSLRAPPVPAMDEPASLTRTRHRPRHYVDKSPQVAECSPPGDQAATPMTGPEQTTPSKARSRKHSSRRKHACDRVSPRSEPEGYSPDVRTHAVSPQVDNGRARRGKQQRRKVKRKAKAKARKQEDKLEITPSIVSTASAKDRSSFRPSSVGDWSDTCEHQTHAIGTPAHVTEESHSPPTILSEIRSSDERRKRGLPEAAKMETKAHQTDSTSLEAIHANNKQGGIGPHSNEKRRARRERKSARKEEMAADCRAPASPSYQEHGQQDEDSYSSPARQHGVSPTTPLESQKCDSNNDPALPTPIRSPSESNLWPSLPTPPRSQSSPTRREIISRSVCAAAASSKPRSNPVDLLRSSAPAASDSVDGVAPEHTNLLLATSDNEPGLVDLPSVTCDSFIDTQLPTGVDGSMLKKRVVKSSLTKTQSVLDVWMTNPKQKEALQWNGERQPQHRKPAETDKEMEPPKTPTSQGKDGPVLIFSDASKSTGAEEAKQQQPNAVVDDRDAALEHSTSDVDRLAAQDKASPPQTQTNLTHPQTPTTSQKRTASTPRAAAKKSPYFSSSTTPSKKSSPKTPTKRPNTPTSRIPIPPLSSKNFGLIQELLAASPFHLLLAVILLNKTSGTAAIPAYYTLTALFPTPEALAAASVPDILDVIKHLGLQNVRANTIKILAGAWCDNPPDRGRRYRTLHYPRWGDGVDVGPREVLGAEEAAGGRAAALEEVDQGTQAGAREEGDPRTGAWEIAHLPGIGAYALDSWRIFCRDVLRGLADDWRGTNASFRPRHRSNYAVDAPVASDDNDGERTADIALAVADDEETEQEQIQEQQQEQTHEFEPEWKRVLPQDKELRAFLRWMWLREGWDWDPLSGERRRASREVLDGVARGGDGFEGCGASAGIVKAEAEVEVEGGVGAGVRVGSELVVVNCDLDDT